MLSKIRTDFKVGLGVRYWGEPPDVMVWSPETNSQEEFWRWIQGDLCKSVQIAAVIRLVAWTRSSDLWILENTFFSQFLMIFPLLWFLTPPQHTFGPQHLLVSWPGRKNTCRDREVTERRRCFLMRAGSPSRRSGQRRSGTVDYPSARKKNEIMPFVLTWTDPQTAMLREVSQTEKTDAATYGITYMQNLRKQYKWTYLPSTVTDVENKFTVTKGKE